MRLLICTQSIDTDEPLLGFFHGWVLELAKHFESIEIICLRAGTYALPQNVRVHSLGKEHGESRLKYVWRFYTYLRTLRGTYDRVYVHMNPHYVLLGGVNWKIKGIPIFFSRNHAQMNLMTQIAARFAQKIFYTSPYACTSVFSHAMQIPVGIDTNLFTPGNPQEHTTKKILLLGRLSPVKHLEVCIDAARLLPPGYEVHVYGDDPTREKKYESSLKARAGSNVFFHPGVRNEETPPIYRMHDIYVNLTPKGSMDKTVLEAVSCGVMTIVANVSFSDVVPESAILSPVTPEALAQQIITCATREKGEIQAELEHSRRAVVEKHSLEKLATMLHNVMQ